MRRSQQSSRREKTVRELYDVGQILNLRVLFPKGYQLIVCVGGYKTLTTCGCADIFNEIWIVIGSVRPI
jgi:hypothetical protein